MIMYKDYKVTRISPEFGYLILVNSKETRVKSLKSILNGCDLIIKGSRLTLTDMKIINYIFYAIFDRFDELKDVF